VLASADKARALRLERLERALSERLEQPAAALETLIFELKAEEWHPALWEALHAAALRDGQEVALAKGYALVTAERRLKQLPPRARAELLMHAADFYQGIVGDAAQAQAMLELVLQVAPGEPEAYARLEMRFQAAQDRARLLDLYSWVASAPPKEPAEIAREALGTFMHLPQSTVISDQTCMKLLPLAGASTSLLDAVVAHCRKTNRVGLACEFLERAITELELANPIAVRARHQLVELYFLDRATLGQAMPHVESLLRANPNDAPARAAAERLLGSRDVATRAAALLKEHRRARSEFPPKA
jgi:hypothetical protein